MKDMSGTMLLSGDQNGLGWDVPLKLAVLTDRGYRVEHSLHTTDLFSRPSSEGSALVEVTKEAYLDSGNVNRWTASLEAAPFLGQMPIAPAAFTDRGVDLRRVATFHNRPLREIVLSLTQGEWLGLSRRAEGRIAHDMSMGDVLSHFPALRKPLRANLRESVEPHHHIAALQAFDQLFNLSEDTTLPWPLATQRVLKETLARYGGCGGVTLTTTLDAFSRGKDCVRSLLLPIFLEHYRVVRLAYNEAISGPGEVMMPLRDDDLPFYAVLRDRDGRLKRVDLTYQLGDTVSRVLNRARKDGEVVAVVGKAIPHIIELLMEGPVVMCEAASAYIPRVARFAELLETQYGIPLDLRPVVRVRLNALDALSDVPHHFLLPAYLRSRFHTEWISGIDFAARWKQVVAEAEKDLGTLAGKDNMSFLRSQGRLSERVCNLIDSVRDSIVLCGKERAKQHGVPDNLSMFKRTLVALLDGVEAERAAMMRELLAITVSLPYWNCRPFVHWVDALPGWSDAIRRRAEIVTSPLY